MIEISAEVEAFLREVCSRNGQSVDEVLRQILHERQLRMSELFFPHVNDEVRSMIDHFDRELRLRNPGLHYVRRATYVGFRREEIPARVDSGRSQVFASLRVGQRADRILVTLPMPDSPIEQAAREAIRLKDFRRAGGKRQGHHGVGDVELDLRSTDDVQRAIDTFESWLSAQ